MSDDHYERLLAHLCTIPDAKEAFRLLEVLREMGAITAETAALLMHDYWEVG